MYIHIFTIKEYALVRGYSNVNVNKATSVHQQRNPIKHHLTHIVVSTRRTK